MCGRFTLKTPAAILAEYFGVSQLPSLTPRYNIAPSQPVAVVVGWPQREWTSMRWGLVPSFSRDPGIGNRLINARAETVQQRRAFRDAFRERRCLIPADGFFEWQAQHGGRKQPVYLHLEGATPFAFAGLWERWQPRARTGTGVGEQRGEPLYSCTLITTEPNRVVAPIHDRMPVILERHQLATWLDPEVTAADLLELLQPCAAERLRAHPVSTLVNRPTHDEPACIATVAPQCPPPRLFE